jgi:hypothetical protein
MGIDDDDLNAILKRLYPQGYAICGSEGGTGILRIGAREVLNNPLVARDTLSARELRALGRAAVARGEVYVSQGTRCQQLADEKDRAAVPGGMADPAPSGAPPEATADQFDAGQRTGHRSRS